MECVDYLEFQDYLKKSRDVDDKLIYTLNASLPTNSFRTQLDLPSRCKDLYKKIDDNFKFRESSIKKCIEEATNHIQQLQSQQNNDSNVSKQIKNELTKVKLLRTELGVEEVVKDRSQKLFYEKCRSFYKPENLPL
ncbi:hypothetical protein PGB90_006961 [Kerria lacca]